jgi:hypothetical protein
MASTKCGAVRWEGSNEVIGKRSNTGPGCRRGCGCSNCELRFPDWKAAHLSPSWYCGIHAHGFIGCEGAPAGEIFPGASKADTPKARAEPEDWSGLK